MCLNSFDGESSSPCRTIVSRVLLGLLACAPVSCAPALSSTQVSGMTTRDARVQQGNVYYLPRAAMIVWLVVTPTRGAGIVIGQPEYLPDNGASGIDTGGMSADACPAQAGWSSPGAFVLS